MVDLSKEYKFPCGHNNGYKEPLFPFNWVCSICNTHTKEENLKEVL